MARRQKSTFAPTVEPKPDPKWKVALQDEYNALMENQRAYFKACKDFQDECTKNEYLMGLKAEAEAGAAE